MRGWASHLLRPPTGMRTGSAHGWAGINRCKREKDERTGQPFTEAPTELCTGSAHSWVGHE
eukprot:1083373-Pelagomonas_calceolata.AAC.6